MDTQNVYQAFSTKGKGGAAGLHGRPSEKLGRQWPLVWNAAGVDRAVLEIVKRILVTRQRPHYHELPEAWQAAEGMYTTPELQAHPERFFRAFPFSPGRVRARVLEALPDGERLHITFTSPYRTYHAAYQPTYSSFLNNEIVYVRGLFHKGEPRATVVGLHGWCSGNLWVEEQLFAARALYKAGLNVALMVLPFHGARKPLGRYDLNLFPSSDLRRTNEGFGQAIADVQALMAWLRWQGVATFIGVVGLSLGGYVAALLAGLDRSVDYVVPLIAPVSLADLVWSVATDARGKKAAIHAGFDLEQFRTAVALHCPLSHRLKLPKERVLIIGGRGDRVVEPAHVWALWQHWGRPRLSWFPGSHFMHFGRQAYLQQICALMGAHPPPSARSKTHATPSAALWWQNLAESVARLPILRGIASKS